MSAASSGASGWLGFKAAGALLPHRPGVPVDLAQVRSPNGLEHRSVSPAAAYIPPARGPKALRFADRVAEIELSLVDAINLDTGAMDAIELPEELEWRLCNLRVIHRDSHHTVCLGNLRDMKMKTVALKIFRTRDQETKTYMHMAGRLGSVPGALAIFEVYEHPERTFFLTEAADVDLETWIEDMQHEQKEERDKLLSLTKQLQGQTQDSRQQVQTARASTQPEPLISLGKALPLLVDMLLVVKDLQDAGILHADLSEKNFLIKEGRALISDLRVACLEETGHRIFGNRFLRARCSRSYYEYRHAPEALGSLPTGPSNHMWAVGLVFAKMCLGYLPTQRAVTEQAPELIESERSFHGPQNIGRWIRERFDIHDDDGWDNLEDAGVKALIAGMLERDPDKRWHVIGAIAYARRLAVERGIQLLPRRRVPTLTPGLLGPWD